MPRFNVLNLVGKWSKQYANLPDRYIKRAMEQIYWKTPRGKPQYLPRTMQRVKFYFGTNRPWTREFFHENWPNTMKPTVCVEPIKDWSFFHGDKVEILTGVDKGKQGNVIQIIQERNWIIVEGLNTKSKIVGRTKNFSGVLTQEELPLLVNREVKLVDPSDLQPTEIEWRYTESGERVRVSTRSGRVIPMPITAQETIDYKTPSTYKEGPKDTTKKQVEKISFKPELKTFEMDIMDKMGIKEDRVQKKYYWY